MRVGNFGPSSKHNHKHSRTTLILWHPVRSSGWPRKINENSWYFWMYYNSLLAQKLFLFWRNFRSLIKTFSCTIEKRPDLFMVFNYLRLKLKHFLKQFMIGRNFKFMVLFSDFYGHNTNESNLNISHDIMLIWCTCLYEKLTHYIHFKTLFKDNRCMESLIWDQHP